jgi:hypothetical protein
MKVTADELWEMHPQEWQRKSKPELRYLFK